MNERDDWDDRVLTCCAFVRVCADFPRVSTCRSQRVPSPLRCFRTELLVVVMGRRHLHPSDQRWVDSLVFPVQRQQRRSSADSAGLRSCLPDWHFSSVECHERWRFVGDGRRRHLWDRQVARQQLPVLLSSGLYEGAEMSSLDVGGRSFRPRSLSNAQLVALRRGPGQTVGECDPS